MEITSFAKTRHMAHALLWAFSLWGLLFIILPTGGYWHNWGATLFVAASALVIVLGTVFFYRTGDRLLPQSMRGGEPTAVRKRLAMTAGSFLIMTVVILLMRVYG